MTSSRYHLKRSERTQQRFSLRKFSVGTASVLLGTWMAMSGPVSADELVQTQPSTPDSSQELSGNEESLDQVEDSLETPSEPVQPVEKSASEETVVLEEVVATKSVVDNVSAAEEVSSEVVKPRLVGLSYKVSYTDAETGDIVYSENRTVAETTTAPVLETNVTVNAVDIPGYKLAEAQVASQTQVLREKQSNLITFKVVKDETKATPPVSGADFRYSQSGIENDKPYITLERYWGTDSTSDRKPDYAIIRNGAVANIVYKMGLTRITADQVDLTEDAKKLGLTFNEVTNEITGNLELGENLKIGTYKIGLISKDKQTHAIADLHIQSHKGFVLRLDATRSYEQAGLPDETSDTVPYNEASVRNLSSSNLIASSVEVDGRREEVNAEFSSLHNTPATDLTYSGTEVTTTTFGYYVKDGLITDVNSTTPQYQARFTLFGLDARGAFVTPLKVRNFTQTGGSEDVEVELIDKTKLDPFADYNSMNEQEGHDYGRGRLETPYFVHFKKLPKTAGNYYVTFSVTDNLGLKKDFRLNFTAFERSQDGALTSADVRFKGNSQYLPAGVEHVTVVRSSESQELGTVEKNKLNATIIPLNLPDALEFNEATGVLRKKDGVLLTPGVYKVNFKALD